MIVADATLVSGLLFPEDSLHALAHAVRRKDADWHCPELVLSEVRSVALKLHRRGADLALMIERCRLATAAVSVYRMHPFAVLHAAVEGGLWAYDAEYVALARQLSVRVVTTDELVLKAFPKLAVAPDAFAD